MRLLVTVATTVAMKKEELIVFRYILNVYVMCFNMLVVDPNSHMKWSVQPTSCVHCH